MTSGNDPKHLTYLPGFDAPLPSWIASGTYPERTLCMEALANFARDNGFQIIIRTSQAKTIYLSCRRGRIPNKGRTQANVSSYLSYTKCPYSLKMVEQPNSHYVVRLINPRHNHSPFPDGFEPPSSSANTTTSSRSRSNKRQRLSLENQVPESPDRSSTSAAPTPANTLFRPNFMALRSSAASDISSCTESTLVPRDWSSAYVELGDNRVDASHLPSSRTAVARKRAVSPARSHASTMTNATAINGLLSLSVDSTSGAQSADATRPASNSSPDPSRTSTSAMQQPQDLPAVGAPQSTASELGSERATTGRETGSRPDLRNSRLGQPARPAQTQPHTMLPTRSSNADLSATSPLDASTHTSDMPNVSTCLPSEHPMESETATSTGSIPVDRFLCLPHSLPRNAEGDHARADASLEEPLPIDLCSLLRNPPSADRTMEDVTTLEWSHIDHALEWCIVLRTALQMHRRALSSSQAV